MCYTFGQGFQRLAKYALRLAMVMTQFNLGFGWANVVGASLALAKMLMGKCIIKKPLQTQLLVIKCQVNTELYKPQCATALSLAHTVYLSLSLSLSLCPVCTLSRRVDKDCGELGVANA